MARACAITYFAAVMTVVLLPHRPATQNIEQQVIVMPEATPEQVSGQILQQVEDLKHAVSHTR